MTKHDLARAWVLLAALTVVSTLLHFSDLPAALMGVMILIIAGAKARLILLDYLELRGVMGWQGGILAGLAALISVMLVLLLAA